MKKKLIKLSLLFVIFFTVSSVSAQVYVTIRPPVPVIVRPPQPSRVHVWVNEEWEPSGRSYRYSGGRWEAPRRGYYRKQGHWKQTRRGQVWVQGGWSRQRSRRN